MYLIFKLKKGVNCVGRQVPKGNNPLIADHVSILDQLDETQALADQATWNMDDDVVA